MKRVSKQVKSIESQSSQSSKGRRQTRKRMEFEPGFKPKGEVLESFQVYDEEFYRSEVIKPVSSSSSMSSFRLPDIIMTENKKGILKNRPKSPTAVVSSTKTSPCKVSKRQPVLSIFLFFLLISLFLVLLLIGIDQLGFPTLIEACYKFPDGVKDPCSDMECK